METKAPPVFWGITQQFLLVDLKNYIGTFNNKEELLQLQIRSDNWFNVLCINTQG